MLCNKCKRDIGNNTICPSCGTSIYNNGVVSSTPYFNTVNQNNMFTSSSVSVNNQAVTGIETNGNDNSKIKKTIIVVMLLIIVALLSYIVLKSNNGNKVILKDKGTRTIMVYMIGSNLESEYKAASMDIEEILATNYNEDDVNILIYTGGSKKWKNPSISNEENAIFEVKNGFLNKLETYSQKSMTDSSTLKEFISYVYDNYRTDLYDLILWDHGGGPIYGFGQDEVSGENDTLTIDELTRAIKNSSLSKETKLEYIGFDACLMSSVEVANSLREYANYLIASEESIPGNGWNYEFLNNLDKNTKIEDLYKSIVDNYIEYYEEARIEQQKLGYKYNPDVTLSVTDLSKVQNLVQEIDNLFANIGNNISISNYSKVSKEFSKTKLYGYQGVNESSYDLVDLYDLADQIIDEYPEAANVQLAIKDTVVYEKNNLQKTNGLSIYFPLKNKKNASSLVNMYSSLNFSNNYKSFLRKYVSISDSDRMVTSSSKNLIPKVDQITNTVSVDISDDLAYNYESAKYVIYRKLSDNKYMVVNISSDVELNGNTLTAQADKQQLIVHPVLKSKEGQTISPGWVTMLEVSRDKDKATYAIAAILERYTDKLELKSVFLMYEVDNDTKEGSVIDVVEMSSFGTTAAKGGIDIQDWQDIKFVNYAYKLFDENGEYLDKIESYNQTYVTTSDITEDGIDLEFVSLDYEMNTTIADMSGNQVDEQTDDYYYQFIVTDTQGENHRTGLINVMK